MYKDWKDLQYGRYYKYRLEHDSKHDNLHLIHTNPNTGPDTFDLYKLTDLDILRLEHIRVCTKGVIR